VLANRGDHKHLVSVDESGNVEMIELCWRDRNRRHFVGNAEGTDSAEPIFRTHWTQVEENQFDKPERLKLVIPQMQMSKLYYDAAGAIDQHHRQRQHDLEFEQWLRFKYFEKHVGSTMLGMIIVNAQNIHQTLAGKNCDPSPNVWYYKLADELIKNTVDLAPTSVRTRGM
jgi:hypothetical protein